MIDDKMLTVALGHVGKWAALAEEWQTKYEDSVEEINRLTIALGEEGLRAERAERDAKDARSEEAKWEQIAKIAETRAEAADRIDALEAENKALRDKCEEQESLLRSWHCIDFENGTEHDDALLEYCVDETRHFFAKEVK